MSESSPGMNVTSRRINLAAAVLVASTASITYGMSVPLMSLVLAAQDVPTWLIGLNGTAQALAVLPLAPLISRWLRAWGPARLLILVLVIQAAVFVAMAMFQDVWLWFPLRFVLGAAGSAMWIIAEAWINQVVDDRTRGRVLSLNSMAVAAGFALGPFILSMTGSAGWLPFLVLIGVLLMMVVPALCALNIAPSLAGEAESGVFGFVLRAPVPVLIAGLYAAVEGLLLTFLPIYALQFGVPEQESLMMITALGIGGIVGQVPFGWMIDRLDRYRLASVSAVMLIAASALMMLAVATPGWGIVFFALFGVVHGGLYTTGMALLGAEFQGPDLAVGSSAFGVAWGVGVMAGPAVGGFAMRVMPEVGLPLCIGAALVIFLPFPTVPRLRRPKR